MRVGEPGSFRDPESRVFYSGGEVFRELSPTGLADFHAAVPACQIIRDGGTIEAKQ